MTTKTKRDRKSKITTEPNPHAASNALIAASLIDQSMEMATSASEAGIVGHAPIDSALYAPVHGDHELDAIVAEVEADLAAKSVLSSEATTETAAPAPTEQPADFAAAIASLDPEKINETVIQIASEIDNRIAFQKAKDADNSNIIKTLEKVRKQLVTKRAASVLLVTNVDPAMINRQTHEGSRYNVYALGKLSDIIYGVTDGVIANAINRAVMKSLFQFRAADKQFTGHLAKAAASDKIRDIDPALKGFLVRHTVSASTAPTQASSTMQALETLGVVKASGGGRNPNYSLTDAPIVGKLEGMLKAAA